MLQFFINRIFSHKVRRAVQRVRMIMKIINSIIGIIVIIVGSFFMSITVDNETFKTISYKVVGCLIFFGGMFYLKKIAKFGKQ